MPAVLPNTIIAGVQKGATTALYSWLAQHPDIFGETAMKDFPYFCQDGYIAEGTDWFARRFSRWQNEKIVLHGYVHYLFLAEQVAPLLMDFNPELRLLIVLRNPIDRAFSGYLQARKKGHESRDTFEEAIQDDLSHSLTTFKDITNRSYLSHGMYSEQLAMLFRHIPQAQVKIILFEDLNADPQRVCKSCFEFLGVDPGFQPELIRKNDYGVPRSQAIQKIIAGGLFSTRLRDLIPINLRIHLRRLLHNMNTRRDEKPRLTPETRKQLEQLFAPEIPRIEQISGLDLSAWKSSSQ